MCIVWLPSATTWKALLISSRSPLKILCRDSSASTSTSTNESLVWPSMANVDGSLAFVFVLRETGDARKSTLAGEVCMHGLLRGEMFDSDVGDNMQKFAVVRIVG